MVMVGIWLDATHAYPETIFIKLFLLISNLSQGGFLSLQISDMPPMIRKIRITALYPYSLHI